MLAMAGRPKARLRDLTTKLEAAGIDPATLETPAPPHVRPVTDGGDVESLRASARTRARTTPTDARPMNVGPHTRSSVDTRTSDDLEALAQQMRPNLIARIERLRPTWAAGWIEDYPIDTGELGELLAYVRDEHGGANYKITILSPDQTVLYTSRIPIAGMPRKRGRELPRARWDGSDDEPGPRAALRDAETREPRQTNGTSANDLAALVTALGSVMGGGNRDHVLEAVREMTQTTQKQTSDLIAAVLATRSAERQSTGLVGQLREVVQATAGIRELREALAEDAPEPREEGAERSSTTRLMETAAMEMLRQGIANDAARQQAQQQRPPQRPAVRMRPTMRRQPPPNGSQPPPTPRSA